MRALAVKSRSLPRGVPFQTGGGTARLVSAGWVVWAKAPDRFEAGTPAIVNVIAFAIALHMHQPLIPAGGNDLGSAAIISNLKHMMDNQGIGDNHNAPVFLWCYRRMGELIPQLIGEGKQPRVRGMMMYRADASGLIFHTGNYKALAQQLAANQQVEVCFNSQDTQVRVACAWANATLSGWFNRSSYRTWAW